MDELRMPLQGPRKLRSAFLGGESYPTTTQSTKRTSEAPSPDIVDLLKMHGFGVVEGAEAVREKIKE